MTAWTLGIGLDYNAVADALLRAVQQQQPAGGDVNGSGERRAEADRWMRRLARAVTQPAAEILDFIYADKPKSDRLSSVRGYRPRGGLRIGAATEIRGRRTRLDAARVQRELRRGIAELVLAPGIEHARDPLPFGPRGEWRLPRIGDVDLLCVRSSAWGLGPDVVTVDYLWKIDALLGASVLLDALPWLRFCKLCGRLFFKIKRQEFCRREHGNIAAHRSAGESDRGRPRESFEAENVERHNAWLRFSDARRP